MNGDKIKQYDTVKDKKGDRYRVVEVGSDGKGHVIAKLKGITPDNRSKRGPARLVEVSVLEEEYTRIDLPEVTVIQPASKPAENAMQKQRETVGEYGDMNLKQKLADSTQLVYDLRTELEALKDAHEVLQEEKKYMERQLELADQDITEMKKTISKMKDAHDEEVRALEDELMEVKIVAKKTGQYSDALDDDSVVFGKIYTLTDAMLDLAASMMKMAKSIKDETEERI